MERSQQRSLSTKGGQVKFGEWPKLTVLWPDIEADAREVLRHEVDHSRTLPISSEVVDVGGEA